MDGVNSVKNVLLKALLSLKMGTVQGLDEIYPTLSKETKEEVVACLILLFQFSLPIKVELVGLIPANHV